MFKPHLGRLKCVHFSLHRFHPWIIEQDISGIQAKKILATAIKNENKQKPLSDQELVDLLKRENGLVLARRTVGKYREQLGIPSSTKRKRYDKNPT